MEYLGIKMTWDTRNVCRFCLSARKTYSILDIHKDVSNLINTMFPTIQISPTDMLPKGACAMCVASLNSCLKIQARFEVANEALLDYIKNEDMHRLKELAEVLIKITYSTTIQEVLTEKEKYIRPIKKVDCATWTGEENQIIAADQAMNVNAVPESLSPMETQEDVVEGVSHQQNNDDLNQDTPESGMHTSLQGEVGHKEAAQLNSPGIMEALEVNTTEIQLQGPFTCKSKSHPRESKITSLDTPKYKQNGLQMSANATLGQQIITDIPSTESSELPANIITNETRSTDVSMPMIANTSPLVLDASSSGSSIAPNFESLNLPDQIQAIKAAIPVINKESQTWKENTSIIQLASAVKELTSQLQKLLMIQKPAEAVDSPLLNETQTVENTEKLLSDRSVLLNNHPVPCMAKVQSVEGSCSAEVNDTVANNLSGLPVNAFNSAKPEAFTLTPPEIKTEFTTATETVTSQMEMSFSTDQNLVHELLTSSRNVGTQAEADKNLNVNESALDNNTGLHKIEAENSVPVKQLEIQFLEKNRQGETKKTETQRKNSSVNILGIEECAFSKGMTFSDKSVESQTVVPTLMTVEKQESATATEAVRVHTQLSSSRLPNVVLQMDTAEMEILETDLSPQGKERQTLVPVESQCSVPATSGIPDIVQQSGTAGMENCPSKAEESHILVTVNSPKKSVSADALETPSTELEMETAEIENLEGVSLRAEESHTLVSVNSPKPSTSTDALEIPNTELQMETIEIQNLEGVSLQAEESHTLVSVNSPKPSTSTDALEIPNTELQMETAEIQNLEGVSPQEEESHSLVSANSPKPLVSTNALEIPNTELQTAEIQNLEGGSLQAEESHTLVSVNSPKPSTSTDALEIPNTELQMETAEIQNLEGVSPQEEESHSLVSVNSPKPSTSTDALEIPNTELQTAEIQNLEGGSLQAEESHTLVSVNSPKPSTSTDALEVPNTELQTAEIQNLEGGSLQAEESHTLVSINSPKPSTSTDALEIPNTELQMETAEIQNLEGVSPQEEESHSLVSVNSPKPSVSTDALEIPNTELQTAEIQNLEGGSLQAEESHALVSVNSPKPSTSTDALEIPNTELQTAEIQNLEGGSLQAEESDTLVSVNSPKPSTSTDALEIPNTELQMETAEGVSPQKEESHSLVSVNSPKPFTSTDALEIPNTELQIQTAEIQNLEGVSLQAEESHTLVSVNSPKPSTSTDALEIPNTELQMETAEIQNLEGVSPQEEESHSLVSANSPKPSTSTDALEIPNTELQMETAEIQNLEGVSLLAEESHTLVSVNSPKPSTSTDALVIPNTELQMQTAEIQTPEGDFLSCAEGKQIVSSHSFSMLRTQHMSQNSEREQISFPVEQEAHIPVAGIGDSVGREISPVSAETGVTKQYSSLNEEGSWIMISYEPPFSTSSTIAVQKTALQIQEEEASFLEVQQGKQISGSTALQYAIVTEDGKDILLEPVIIPATEEHMFPKTEESNVLATQEPQLSEVGVQTMELEMLETEIQVPLEQTETQIHEESEWKLVTEIEVVPDIPFVTILETELKTEPESPIAGSSNSKLMAYNSTECNTPRVSTKQSRKRKKGPKKRKPIKNRKSGSAATSGEKPISDDDSYYETYSHSTAKKRKTAPVEEVEEEENTIYICTHCSYQTNDSYELDEHFTENHKEMGARVAQHIRDGKTNKFVFRCEMQQTTSSEKQTSPSEKQTFLAEKQICPYCGSKVDAAFIKAHVDSHGVKPYLCTICGRGFMKEENFNNHRCRSFSEKVKCNVCQEELAGASLLTMHILEKHNSEYTCTLCSKTFTCESELLQHKTEVHSDASKCELSPSL